MFKAAKVTEFLRWRQRHLIFGPDDMMGAISGASYDPLRPPFEYKGMEAFKKEQINFLPPHTGRLAIWHKQATDENQPVYIAFHGRAGNWADSGVKKNMNYDRHYRLAWLRAMAETGAEVIAVHMRGQGDSRQDGTIPSENSFKEDVKAIADYIKKKEIDPRRIILVGESLGGASAIMLAEELSHRKMPPAIIATIGTFSSITDYIGDTYPDLATPIKKALRYPMSSKARIEKLDNSTKFYIAHAPSDERIPYANKERLAQSAKNKGIQVVERVLEGEYLHPNCGYIHVGWKAEKIVEDLQAMYQKKTTNQGLFL